MFFLVVTKCLEPDAIEKLMEKILPEAVSLMLKSNQPEILVFGLKTLKEILSKGDFLEDENNPFLLIFEQKGVNALLNDLQMSPNVSVANRACRIISNFYCVP